MSNVSNIVKSIQDIMRKDAGTYGDAQRLEQLGWMFFLKIFDDSEDELELLRDNYRSPLPKHLHSAGNAGEFYTPRAVTQSIVEQVNPRLGESILDPACGTGGFLVCAIEHLRKQARSGDDERATQDCFAGVEKKHLPHVLCM